MPLATMRAFADHGTVPGKTAEIDPGDDLAALERAGIDMEKVTAELLIDGIDQFVASMNSLLDGIEERRAAYAES
jgi:transaldolase